MGLDGRPFLVLLGVACVGAPVALVLLWGRVRGVPALRTAQRVGLVLTCQVTAVLLAGAAVNDYFSLYVSWSDLLGSANGTIPAPQHAAGGPLVGNTLVSGDHHGSGARVVPQDATGGRSGIHDQAWAILPPGYENPANAHRTYPLVEFLPGYPGEPSTWVHALHLADAMDALISTGQVQPFVAVVPSITVAPPQDTECTNVPGGPAVATWLEQDVPEFITHQLRIRPASHGWGVVGYSTGGFCAAKLALQFPSVFRAAVSLSGYYTPATDPTTGGLFRGRPALLTQNSPDWLAGNGHQPAVDILAVTSPRDSSSWSSTQSFLRAVKRPVSVDTIVLPEAGHNTGVWNAVLPESLRWLMRHVDAPAASTPTVAPGL